MEIAGGTADAIVHQFTAASAAGPADDDDAPLARADNDFFAELVRGARGRLAELDDMISGCLDDAWPAERMEILLRAILRCGAYELFAGQSAPARVVISEYVGVADAFFDGKEPALVNAVLDRLARVLRPDEFTAAGEAR